MSKHESSANSRENASSSLPLILVAVATLVSVGLIWFLPVPGNQPGGEPAQPSDAEPAEAAVSAQPVDAPNETQAAPPKAQPDQQQTRQETETARGTGEEMAQGEGPVRAPAPAAGVSMMELPEAQPGKLNVAGWTPLTGQAFRDSAVVFFDAPVDPASAGQPGVIEPALEGEWRVGGYYAAFLPSEVQRDTVYTLTLSDKLASTQGAPLNPAHREILLPSYAFRLVRFFELSTSPEETILGMLFSAPVRAEDVDSHIHMTTHEGDEAACDVVQGTNERTVLLRFASGTAFPVSLVLEAGLPDAAGAAALPEPQRFRYPSSDLKVAQVRWGGFQPEQQEVVFQFGQPVEPDALADHLTLHEVNLDKPLEFQVAPDTASRQLRAVLQLPDPTNAQVRVHISKGLPGGSGTSLESLYQTFLHREVPPLTIDRFWWSQRGEQGLVLRLYLNAEAEVEALREHLELEPEVANLEVRPAGGAFQLFGDWDSRRSYTLRLTPGLNYAGTAVLREPVEREVFTEDVPKYAGFNQEGAYYFPRRSPVPLKMRTRNVDEARLEVYRLFPSNIAVAMDSIYDGETDSRFWSRWSEPLSSEEIELQAPADRMFERTLGLEKLLPEDAQGVFCLRVSDTEKEYISGSKLVLQTDMGVLAHWRDEELVLFAHDLFTLDPKALAKVTVYSDKNQVLGEANTDEHGLAHLGPFETSLGTPSVAVVQHEEDYTFLELEPRPGDAENVSADMPAYDHDAYDAFIYADRELYRPGETAHLRWLVRTGYRDAVGGVPLLMKVYKPNGRELESRAVTLSELGTGGYDLPTQKAYPTGKYRVSLLVPGENTPIGSYTFSLEDFVPNRIKVETTLGNEPWVAGKECRIAVNAQHLFGAPASDRRCEARVILRRGAQPFEQWSRYTFDNDAEFSLDDIDCGEAVTDAEGNAEFKFTYEPPAEAAFPLQAIAVGRVSELGGRAVAGVAQTVMFPSETALGVTVASPEQGEGAEVFVCAIGPDGEAAPLDTVKVTLERRTWSYYVRRYYSHHRSEWADQFEAVETRGIALENGQGSAVFDLDQWGYYRVRVHSEATPQYSSMTFHAYGGKCRAVTGARPSLITLRADKDTYQPGDKASIQIESPFDGQGIVVVQGDSLKQMIPVKIENGAATLELRILDDFFPNVWVEATVIHAVETDRKKVYPFSSFEMLGLDIDDASRRLDLAFPALPEAVRPDQEVAFEVLAKDATGAPVEAEVTLAAVDEGIHSITGYESPDPYAWLGRPRRPDQRRAHYYDKIAYDFDEPAPGGDLDALLGRRASAIGENWIKPLALWSGAVRTGPDGRATVSMRLPEFSGQLRLVAVGCTASSLGAADGYIFVRRPHMLRTSMPRFMLPGDRATCRAVLFNHTDEACSAAVSWQVAGALTSGEGTKRVDVPAGGEAAVWAECAAGQVMGDGRLIWDVSFRDAQENEVAALHEEAALPVRAPAAYQSAYHLLVLEAGESRALTNDTFVNDKTARLHLVAGFKPELQLVEPLRYLIGYPYGCVEQTVSRLMPLYLLRKSAAATEMALGERQETDSYIRAGIDKLFSMQTESGGMGYWPGSSDAYPYGSVYALHFLELVANGREFNLAEDAMNGLREYVRGVMNRPGSGSYSDLYLRAYALYALALGGDLKAVQQIDRFDTAPVPRAARMLLAAALAINTQDRDRVTMYLDERPWEEFNAREQGGTLNSELRNKAVRLLALTHTQTRQAEQAELAQDLAAFLRTHRHGNTQETAFVVTALCEYLAHVSQDGGNRAATIDVDGETAELGADTAYDRRFEGPLGEARISNTGDSPLYIGAAFEGVPQQPNVEASANGIACERTFLTQGGETVSGPLTHGGSYLVRLDISCETDIENVVVVDKLAAGTEIENPRLEAAAMPTLSVEPDLFPAYQDVRDDRLILAFDRIEQGEHRFFYVVRAVTPGDYRLPPLQAECMYDARLQGNSAPGNVEVARP